MIKEKMRCPCSKCKDKPYEINPLLLEFVYALEQGLKASGKTVNINSGKRCLAYNASVGGYANSPHVFGKAADISVAGMSMLELAKLCITIGFLRIGIYPNHVHVDVVVPHPSKFWYVKRYGVTPIYSGKENNLEKFLMKVR